MPLPAPNSPYPPKGMGSIHDAIRVWSAWFEADREALARVYGGAGGFAYGPATGSFGSDHPSQYRGGAVGAVARFFWGTPPRPEQRSPKLHVPVAADIASISAALLFGEQPTITAADETTQARVEDLLDERTWEQLINAAELCAGLGDVYLRVAWDQTIADRPLLSALGPDLAVPVFRWGQLAEVTFCWQLSRGTGGEVLRHLEHHAPGYVEHALYLGEDDNLGRVVPLTEHYDTAGLTESLDDDGVVPTGLTGLDVVHVTNVPHRGWRNHPVGQNLGQPDIKGVEPLLDALDEAMTSWMRDVRLGKARIIVPQNYLETLGRGQGATFDMDREVFVAVNALAQGTFDISAQQFAIRHTEHAATMSALLERAISGAGYSAQTFGLTGEVAMTATESHARERRTYQTRAGKIRRWRPALAELVEIMLAVDVSVFGSRVTPSAPLIEFPPAARDNVEVLARTSQMLRAAEAASTETLVRMNHPDWEPHQVDDEVTLITGDRQADLTPLAPLVEIGNRFP